MWEQHPNRCVQMIIWSSVPCEVQASVSSYLQGKKIHTTHTHTHTNRRVIKQEKLDPERPDRQLARKLQRCKWLEIFFPRLSLPVSVSVSSSCYPPPPPLTIQPSVGSSLPVLHRLWIWHLVSGASDPLLLTGDASPPLTPSPPFHLTSLFSLRFIVICQPEACSCITSLCSLPLLLLLTHS